LIDGWFLNMGHTPNKSPFSLVSNRAQITFGREFVLGVRAAYASAWAGTAKARTTLAIASGLICSALGAEPLESIL